MLCVCACSKWKHALPPGALFVSGSLWTGSEQNLVYQGFGILSPTSWGWTTPLFIELAWVFVVQNYSLMYNLCDGWEFTLNCCDPCSHVGCVVRWPPQLMGLCAGGKSSSPLPTLENVNNQYGYSPLAVALAGERRKTSTDCGVFNISACHPEFLLLPI